MLLQGNIYGVVGRWYLVVGCWYLVVGIGFQPKLPTTYNLLSIDILFLNNQTTSFVWKTVPCRCMLIAFFICFGTVFQTNLVV